MLSEKEKQEILEDGLNMQRRDNFRKAKSLCNLKPESLDEYILFLNQVQFIFGPFPISQKKSISYYNKI